MQAGRRVGGARSRLSSVSLFFCLAFILAFCARSGACCCCSSRQHVSWCFPSWPGWRLGVGVRRDRRSAGAYHSHCGPMSPGCVPSSVRRHKITNSKGSHRGPCVGVASLPLPSARWWPGWRLGVGVRRDRRSAGAYHSHCGPMSPGCVLVGCMYWTLAVALDYVYRTRMAHWCSRCMLLLCRYCF